MELSNEEKVRKYDEMKKKREKYWKKRLCEDKILRRKCKEKGIVVSEEEIVEEMKKMKKK